ncbi:myo-inositol-1(or 4)-monophosphatase [Ketogulonicigenium robustum]|uniref:Inositol-1-monophosphatase n=1 Tax=Ketogulonicigenium robustum TaxID=92947 RepID=A0A1W6P1E1_9RHOB|nr:inositol monophosphatase family protein [Ketogulonicigenium robustum]ARO15150.1 myo-inositol-1(or 4)-monophosphatase [Ketogulonicigenium robustum]
MAIGSANLNIMIKVARKAGRALVKDFGEVENLQSSARGTGDFTTRADKRSLETMRDELIEARPSYGFSAPEVAIEGEDPTRRWLVDPLNGAVNYLHGLPHWAVSIALEHKGTIVAGVVYDPVKDECFFAEKGAGSWMNQTRIRVSARTRLVESLFATGVPSGKQRTLPAMLQDLARIMPESSGVRASGSAALDMAYVSTGRYEGYWQRETKAWEIAAGIILVQEAGGFAGPIRDDHDPLVHGDVVAANGEIFDRFAKLVRARPEAALPEA